MILPEPDESGSKSLKDREMNRKVEPKQRAIINKSTILVAEKVFILRIVDRLFVLNVNECVD